MLEVIENQLKLTREHRGLTVLDIERQGIVHSVIYKLENGDNYTLTTLLEYIKILKCKLLINDVAVNNLLDLGEQLKKNRVLQGYTLITLEKSSGLSNKRILCIEKGRGCYKATLAKYLSVININISVI